MAKSGWVSLDPKQSKARPQVHVVFAILVDLLLVL